MLNNIPRCSIANIKKVSRYFKTPGPQACEDESGEGTDARPSPRGQQTSGSRCVRQSIGDQQFQAQNRPRKKASEGNKWPSSRTYEARRYAIEETQLALDHQVDRANVASTGPRRHPLEAVDRGGLARRVKQKYS